MQCTKCGLKNPENSKYCIKCKKELIDIKSEYCPNCKKPLLFPDKPCPYCTDALRQGESAFCNDCKIKVKKNKLFPESNKLSPLERAVLNLDSSIIFCNKCIEKQKAAALSKIDVIENDFQNYMKEMPVLSIEKPENLTVIKYNGIVTAQSIVNTGEIKEFIKEISINNDNSSEFEYKINLGEKSCISTLKKRAVKLGANAVIGSDIEYAEINDSKHTFMITMLGTAVVVEEFNILSEYEQKIYNLIIV